MTFKLSVVRLLLLLLFLPLPMLGQFSYKLSTDIPVEINSETLLNPWAGGLNSPQVNKMHLNGDNTEDLVVFDKTTAQVRTFISMDGAYHYAPEYEPLFPPGLSTFLALRDFNCDGKKDLFTFGQIGILVYQQVPAAGKPFGWSKMNFPNLFTGGSSEVLLTKGFTSQINLLPGTNDLPDFTDMDGDGDLDVLNMRFVSPSTAEYHKNFSMENHGVCNLDSLARMTSNWGGFLECSCGKVAFGTQTCADIGGRTNHTGGKALLTLDNDGDGDKDLLFTEESCFSLYRMENLGTTDAPVMNNLEIFPAGLTMPNYPAPYLEDVDHDGNKDLLIGLNLSSRDNAYNDFGSSLWLYRNLGSDASPVFDFVQANFLQDEMIEVGDQSAPFLADLDRDGDLDLLVGTFINPKDFRGSLALYENVGTTSSPAFRWVTDDYAFLAYTSLYNIRPQVIDLNSDGTQDLAFTATTGGNTRLFTLLAPPGGQPAFDGQNLPSLDLPLGPSENATLVDVDQDGRLDVLVGKSTGELYYYHASGNSFPYTYQLASDAFLGLGSGSSRQHLAAAVGDLDGDGMADLIAGEQAGTLTVYNDFRSANPTPATQLVLDIYTNTYQARNLGGNTRPAIGNLLAVDRPSLVVGNRQGGLHVLHNDNSGPLSEAPKVSLSPNPVAAGQNLTLYADRSVVIEIYTLLGTRLGQAQVIPGGQPIQFPLQGIAAGLYVARFTSGAHATALRFVVY